MSNEKAKFATKIGLVAATVGSAIGLGNVWRFPAETQENGGAAFLLLYMACVFLLGVPVMLGEFALGRGGGSDAVTVFRKLSPGKKWWIVGGVAVFASYLIAVFYMVVAGWTLEYLWLSITGSLYEGTAAEGTSRFTEVMHTTVMGTWGPMISTVLVILLNIAILLRGVEKGIEKLSNWMMPMLFVILVGLCVVSLTLPNASEGLKFFLIPDFSKIDAAAVINALGQTFFSLSLGVGILVTYASYYPADTNLPRTSVTVALLSTLVAVMMGVLIFPAITSFGLQGESVEGTALIFVTLPEVFSRLPLSSLWSSLFFVLLLVAAITSTVSIVEVAVAFCIDRLGMSRFKAVMVTLLPLLVLSPLCALSLGPLNEFKLLGMNMFDFLDNTVTNVLLPTVALLTSLYLGWFGPRKLMKNELTNYGTIAPSRPRGFMMRWLPAIIVFVLRWVAPLLIALIMVAKWI